MKKFVAIVFISFFLFSCSKKKVSFVTRVINSVEIENIIEDSLLNVRALEIGIGENPGFATSNGEIGVLYLEGSKYIIEKEQLKYDTITPNFRSMSYKGCGIFSLSIVSPTLLYKSDVKGKSRVVYKEDHEKAFYDAIEFWNEKEGIAIGDPTDDCMSVIITRDAGESWHKLSCDILPKAMEGEAAFAASDTNIAIVGDKTWVATGGKSSRILYSPDKGHTWEVFETPIVQGLETTGMYSVDFYDELNGFAIGGDYTKPADSSANKIRTQDGGKTWQLVAQNQSPGYRSCVQYIPNRNGKELVAIGFKGIDYSNDSGLTWKHLSDEGFYTLRFLNDSIAYAAGNKRISKLTFKE
ncbi:oxidoreductase [Lacinutrix iliipiscaria]|uniref:Oxidoreductase n=1 Tax=Lacinutrix iliipiscaria TaxID=1230532 RepID=A0ABW5WRU3_9FLAO